MKKIYVLIFSLFLFGCSTQQIQDAVGSILGTNSTTVTESDAAGGLKDALSQGINIGMGLLSKENGFLGNDLVKIPWPEQANVVKDAMLKLGMQKQVDNVTTSLNRAAEKASGVAIEVFVNAIKQMTIQDAMSILLGGDGTATAYLKKTTTPLLTEKFRPIVDNSLGQVNATKYWSDAMNVYNKIPLVKQVNTDLTGFVTEKALQGVFTMVEKEENKIRANPLGKSYRFNEKGILICRFKKIILC
ncbi:MAG: DUF4197 domain-containing protein [Sphingobacteriales bacterium]|nr:MAG: DUF4197 domain-containing protein [Sphingobacteriales bacterium]